MVFLKALCWVPCCSCYTSMIFTWQLNFLKYSILQTIPIACILQKTIRSLCSKVNADLRTLTTWLNANKISLNASKMEFVIFRSKSKPLASSPFLKLVGKKIFPSPSVKYLGVRLDEHLNWKSHISDIATKLQRANGMLSKLRHYLLLKILVNIYHSIFSSRMRYICQIWGLRDNTNSIVFLHFKKLHWDW